MIIPPNARVIEWGDRVAIRHTPVAFWMRSGHSSLRSEQDLERDDGLTAENLVVLATFPEPTLGSIVGGCNEFRYRTAADIEDRGRWRYAYKDGMYWRSGDLHYGGLESLWLGIDGIDLKTVTPLVPRGES